MEWEESAPVVCPWCGEMFDVRIDRSGGRNQEWDYDCEVCCRPMRIRVVSGEAGQLMADAVREG